MFIEVTSVPETARVFSADWLRQVFCRYQLRGLIRERLLFRFAIGIIAFGCVLGGESLLRSYKYYSRIIDARLASGYLTSRPGLYAAPRVIHSGQKYSRKNWLPHYVAPGMSNRTPVMFGVEPSFSMTVKLK